MSNNVIDLKIIQETIDDLKNNPKACKLLGGETALKRRLSKVLCF